MHIACMDFMREQFNYILNLCKTSEVQNSRACVYNIKKYNVRVLQYFHFSDYNYETNSFVDGGLNNVLLSFGMDLINSCVLVRSKKVTQ